MRLLNLTLCQPCLFFFGLRFFFYADEHLPVHVHVENADGRAKIEVKPFVRLVYNKGIKESVIIRAIQIIEIKKEAIIEYWINFHGE